MHRPLQPTTPEASGSRPRGGCLFGVPWFSLFSQPELSAVAAAAETGMPRGSRFAVAAMCLNLSLNRRIRKPPREASERLLSRNGCRYEYLPRKKKSFSLSGIDPDQPPVSHQSIDLSMPVRVWASLWAGVSVRGKTPGHIAEALRQPICSTKVHNCAY